MSEPASKPVTYEDLYKIPENMTAEILNGELVVTPRPSRRHTSAASSLGYKLGPRYQFGEGGGTGAWIIIIEPEIGLGENILVPDLAGWKKQRFPVEEPHNWISVAPDWVCEVLSPGTVGKDKIKKMPIYAQYKVHYAWLVDPLEKTLEVFRLQEGMWAVAGLYGEGDKVKAEPFEEIEIDLNDLWL
ncbi:MAG: Uma2 family endonuclease [Desulfoferrobacter sp.]